MTTLLNKIAEQTINRHKTMVANCKNGTAYIGVFMTRSCLFALNREMTPGYNPPQVMARTDIKDIGGFPIFIIDSTASYHQPPPFTVAICDG